jgi:hypothetical protein
VSTSATKASTTSLMPLWESSLHLLATTPSSPKVPFAHFLWSSVATDQQLPHYSGNSTTTKGLGFLYACIHIYFCNI